jgi:hypothetical protein
MYVQISGRKARKITEFILLFLTFSHLTHLSYGFLPQSKRVSDVTMILKDIFTPLYMNNFFFFLSSVIIFNSEISFPSTYNEQIFIISVLYSVNCLFVAYIYPYTIK